MTTPAKNQTVKLSKNAKPTEVEETLTGTDNGEQVAEQALAEETLTTTKQKPLKKAKDQVDTSTATAETLVEDAVDMIESVAHEVENLKEDKAFKMVPVLLNNIDSDYFKLGGILAVIQAHGWYMDRGHENFKSYIESEVGMAYRKSMYLISIYNGLVESGVKWSDVKHLGWTKLKELANILTPENVAEWVALAENMTVLQLQEYIKNATAGDGSAVSSDAADEVKKTSTKTFKLHDDQKETVNAALDKCKHEMGTDADSVALEHICLDYLAGDHKLKTMPTLAEMMSKLSAEEVLEAFGTIFPEVTLTAELP